MFVHTEVGSNVSQTRTFVREIAKSWNGLGLELNSITNATVCTFAALSACDKQIAGFLCNLKFSPSH